VAAAYLGVTIFASWPLATQLTTSLAGDYGDSAFIAWVMGWVARHLTALLQGDGGAWAAMWQAPIFAPEAATLTYSEHFTAQAAQALPVYWLTGNPLLAYNLMHLAAFLLSALAAHLLAYRFTGSHVAGAVAGLTFAYSPYRLYSMSHLQTLSVHWWIFALLALDVFAQTGARLALAGAAAAIVALSLSSMYLMAFSALFTPLFAVWALARHGRLRDRARWYWLAGAGAASFVCVWPFVRPYLAMREALDFTRTLPEVVGNSVTLAGYWGELPWLGPVLVMAAVGVAIGPASSPRELSRAAKAGLLGMALVALTLALGPLIAVGAHTLPGPYGVLFTYIPGFQGLRVAHRFAVIGLVFLSVLAGVGAARIVRWRGGIVAVLILTALVTRTAWTRPYPIDAPLGSRDLAAVPEYLRPAVATPVIYQFVRTLPATAVLVELPFGDLGYDIRYTFFTLAHDRRTLNGYSGVQPPSYLSRLLVLGAPLADPDASWRALTPATHVVVHTAGWTDDTGKRLRDWLEGHGARALANPGGAWLYELPAPR